MTCDRYGTGIGDNIQLVREIEPGTGFAEAVHRLRGSGHSSTPQQPPAQQRPQLPQQRQQDQDRGREYLEQRKVSRATIEAAEASGMLRYTGDGVLFVGRDADRQPRSATRRAIDPAAPVQKRDLRGSDKSYPPILPGDPGQVWIVEGGADALAVHEIARRKQQKPPTVVVSGGAQCQGFLDNPDVQQRLREAREVTFTTEREKDPETQAKADAARAKQITRAEEITGQSVQVHEPREGRKDIADELEKAHDKAYENIAERQAMQQQQDRQQDRQRSQGMSR